VLKENITHHVEEEESELLPAAEDAMSGEIWRASGKRCRPTRMPSKTKRSTPLDDDSL
jgi:hypothetical protein